MDVHMFHKPFLILVKITASAGPKVQGTDPPMSALSRLKSLNDVQR